MPRNAPRSTARNPNRSDLAAPVTAAPGQPYGVAAQQRMAQGAIPMGPQPTAGGGGPTSPPATAPDIASLMQQHAATAGIVPGQHLQAPTARPNEPVTHGLPMGPGAGPEALTGVGAAAREGTVDQGTLANVLQSMAQNPSATAAIRDLANRAMSGVQ